MADIFDQIHKEVQPAAPAAAPAEAAPAPAPTAPTAPSTEGDVFTRLGREAPPAPSKLPARPPAAPTAPASPSLAEQLGITTPWVVMPMNFFQGLGAGALSTGREISKGLHWVDPTIPEIPESYATPPAGVAGQAGKIAEQGAEFLLPGGAVSKTEKAIEGATKIPRVVRAVLKAVPEAASAAGVTAAQTGGDIDSMKAAALLAGGTRMVMPLVSKAAAGILGTTTGAGSQAIEKAAQGSPEFTRAMRGDITETDILSHLRDAMEGVKDERSAAYQRQFNRLPQNIQVDLDPVRQEMRTALKAQNIGTSIGPNGEILLDFSRSPIRDAPSQNNVLSIVNDLNDWGSRQGDLSPRSVDILKRRIDDVYSPSNNARAFVQRMKNQTRNALNSVPGYQQMTADYARASDFLDNLKDLSLNATNDGTAIRKFGNLMNKNNGFRRDLVRQLSRNAGRDLTAEIAGSRLSSWIPTSGAGRPIDALLGLLGLGHFVSPAPVVAGMATTSPRLMGETVRLAGKAAPLAPKAAGAMPRAIYVHPEQQPNYDQMIGRAAGGKIEDPLRRLPDREAVLRSLRRE
jgi:hypothetical protein